MLHYKTKRLQYQKYSFSFDVRNGDMLVSLQCANVMQAVTTCAVLGLETLPPTEHAMYSHSLRVHFQVFQWKYLNLHCLKLEDWEWTFEGKVLKPIKNHKQLASVKTEIFFDVNVNQPQKNTCCKSLCSSQKHGLKCMVACGECRGGSCGSYVNIIEEYYDKDMFKVDIRDTRTLFLVSLLLILNIFQNLF